MFEVDLKKDSIAIILLFLFVATLTHTYKRNLSRSCLRLTLRRIRLRLFVFSFATLTHAHKPQLLDFHVNKGGGPLPNQKTPKQRASLHRITSKKNLALVSRISPGSNKFKLHSKKQQKSLKMTPK